MSFRVALLSQLTEIGQRPGGVVTRQRQVILPPLLGRSPFTFGTLAMHRAGGATLTLSDAIFPTRIGEVSEIFLTAGATSLTGQGRAVFGTGWLAMLCETSEKVNALLPGPTAYEKVRNEPCSPAGAGCVA